MMCLIIRFIESNLIMKIWYLVTIHLTVVGFRESHRLYWFCVKTLSEEASRLCKLPWRFFMTLIICGDKLEMGPGPLN